MAEKKVITKPIDYAVLNQLSKDFKTCFVPQTELSAEQAFWSHYSVQPEEPNLSASTTIVEDLKELPKVSLVNLSLKRLKFHLASFDMGRIVGNKMHKAFPLLGESSHWQYKFPLPVEGVPTARRMEIPLPRVCTAMMKKLPVKENWQLH
nr:hypothetical protein [Tanacetum cinerariifolium]